MSNETAHVERVKGLFAGQLSDEEVALLNGIKERFRAVVDGRGQFHPIVVEVGKELRQLIRHGFDLSARRNSDACEFDKRPGPGNFSLDAGTTKPTTSEIEFSEDVIGAVDFSLRNGISLEMLANLLCHDLIEIWECGSLDKATLEGFRPKCDGYRFFGAESVGELDPEKE